jgi:hypothetical protein
MHASRNSKSSYRTTRIKGWIYTSFSILRAAFPRRKLQTSPMRFAELQFGHEQRSRLARRVIRRRQCSKRARSASARTRGALDVAIYLRERGDSATGTGWQRSSGRAVTEIDFDGDATRPPARPSVPVPLNQRRGQQPSTAPTSPRGKPEESSRGDPT